jgi:hypothetical protein
MGNALENGRKIKQTMNGDISLPFNILFLLWFVLSYGDGCDIIETVILVYIQEKNLLDYFYISC